jgi:NADH dehydrogenase FAD-containing subunit
LPEWKGERRVLVVLVVGGGAGGFEQAMTMHARLTKEGIPREWPGF